MYKKKKKEKKKYIPYIILLVLLLLSYVETKEIFNFTLSIRDLIYFKYNKLPNSNFELSYNNEIKSSLEELSNLNKLETSLTDFSITYGAVIERDNNSFLNNFIINKGKKDNIELNSAVVDTFGLIGTITKVNDVTSTVSLITNPSKYNNISIRILGNDEVNKILKVENNEFIIEGINKNLDIKIGDKVVTNGLSNKYPSGILVGEIESLEMDNYSISKKAKVLLASNPNNLRYVAILKRK